MLNSTPTNSWFIPGRVERPELWTRHARVSHPHQQAQRHLGRHKRQPTAVRRSECGPATVNTIASLHSPSDAALGILLNLIGKQSRCRAAAGEVPLSSAPVPLSVSCSSKSCGEISDYSAVSHCFCSIMEEGTSARRLVLVSCPLELVRLRPQARPFAPSFASQFNRSFQLSALGRVKRKSDLWVVGGVEMMSASHCRAHGRSRFPGR